MMMRQVDCCVEQHWSRRSPAVERRGWKSLARFALRLQAADEKTGLGRDPRKHALMSATVGSDTLEITMGKASLKICHLAAAY